MSKKFTVTHAKSMKDVVKWVSENQNFEGWWTGSQPKDFKTFNLRGKDRMLVIPADIYDGDMLECVEPFSEQKLYKPSRKGEDLLKRRNRAA